MEHGVQETVPVGWLRSYRRREIAMADISPEPGTGRRTRWIVGGVLALGVLLTLALLRPMAPRKIDILTGPPGSGYHALGLRFATELKRHGISARIVETQGALDNLQRLIVSETPTVAFAQSGIEREIDDAHTLADVVSLGSLAFEPLWFFVRDEAQVSRISDLAGRTLALGPKGSGSRAIGTLLLEANDLLGADPKKNVQTAPFDALADKAAVEALLAGRVDAVFLVGSVKAPIISRLLHAPGVEPLPIPRAQTYAALYSALARFDVPPGVLDLAHNIPPTNVEILAASTNLLALGDLHGAMVEVLLDTSRSAHTGPTLEAPSGAFPSPKYVSLPLSPRARTFYQDGPSKWSRLLPYWASAVVDRIVFVVVPALAILFTVLKLVPLAIGLRFSFRTLSLCRRVVAIEADAHGGAEPAALEAALDEVDQDCAEMHVPPTKVSEYLELRQNIYDARERMAAWARRGSGQPDQRT